MKKSLFYVPGSRTIAVHLFDRLGDEELTNRVEASALFAKLGTVFSHMLAEFCVSYTPTFYLVLTHKKNNRLNALLCFD